MSNLSDDEYYLDDFEQDEALGSSSVGSNSRSHAGKIGKPLHPTMCSITMS
jgi:hypothetical protein